VRALPTGGAEIIEDVKEQPKTYHFVSLAHRSIERGENVGVPPNVILTACMIFADGWTGAGRSTILPGWWRRAALHCGAYAP
jgi:hypothetical protein